MVQVGGRLFSDGVISSFFGYPPFSFKEKLITQFSELMIDVTLLWFEDIFYFRLCVHLEEHTGILACLLCTDLDFDSVEELRAHCSAHDREDDDPVLEATYQVVEMKEVRQVQRKQEAEEQQNVEKMSGM